MNIFALHRNPFAAAAYHCDKHVVKMIVEYAQLLSTAHRVLDGTFESWMFKGANGKPKTLKYYVLPGEVAYPAVRTEIVDGIAIKKDYVEVENRKCYAASHMNHPSGIWARTTDTNYHWLVQLFDGVLREYENRYGKKHSSEALLEFFRTAPKNIPRGLQTPFALAMPEKYKVDDEVLAYQNYYVGDKVRFAKWTNIAAPKWFTNRVDIDPAYFERTRDLSEGEDPSSECDVP